jgi:hypothetical protein
MSLDVLLDGELLGSPDGNDAPDRGDGDHGEQHSHKCELEFVNEEFELFDFWKTGELISIFEKRCR